MRALTGLMMGSWGVLLGVAWAAGAPADQQVQVHALASYSAARAGQDVLLAVVLDIKAGFHAQSHTPNDPNLIALTVTVDENSAIKASVPRYPPGKDETYPGLGTVNVYTGTTAIFIPVKIAENAAQGSLAISGQVRYQVCDDASCFPPQRAKWSATLTIVAPDQPPVPSANKLFTDAATVAASRPVTTAATTRASAPPVLLDDRSRDYGFMGAMAAAFLAGILFNIVPCVLPVLPLKVLGFAEVAHHDRRKTIGLACIFGLGIVAVFAILSVLILGLKKITWGQQFSNPIFAWGIVVILLLLSLWLFGLLNINLPVAAYAFTPRHDTLTGNFLWGMLTAVLSTPCTGPLFPPLMAWAASQPLAIGMAIMLQVGVGMAFPYILLSAFPELARRFPRVGPWAELFKQMLGFMLLGFTVFFAAGRFTTPAGQWWAAVPIALLAALYLTGRTAQLSQQARALAIAAIISVVIVTSAVLVAARFSGAFDTPAPGATGEVAGVQWTPYSDAALSAARAGGKIVLVKFTANWCLNCQYVEATVFHNNQVIAALRKQDVVMLKADLTEPDAPGKPLLDRLNPAGGIPLTAIYAPGYDQPVQLSSVYTPTTLLKVLDQISPAVARGN